MQSVTGQSIYKKKERLASSASALASLDPLSVLLRGYSMLTDGDKIVGSVKELAPGDKLRIEMSDGFADCEILTAFRRDENGKHDL